jgi:transcriptional regulator with XRE-family HTH domain
MSVKAAPVGRDEFLIDIGLRLEKLRGHRSPEEIAYAAKVSPGNKKISGSYLRRVEKGQHAISVDKLRLILDALGSSLGVFFDHLIEASGNVKAENVHYHRILEKALTSKKRDTAIVFMKALDLTIKESERED